MTGLGALLLGGGGPWVPNSPEKKKEKRDSYIRWTPHPVIVTIGDSRDHIRVLLYSYYTTIAGWGVLLAPTRLPQKSGYYWVEGLLRDIQISRISGHPPDAPCQLRSDLSWGGGVL